MTVVFWVFIILILIILWFVLAFLFQPIGKFFYRIWEDAISEIKGGK